MERLTARTGRPRRVKGCEDVRPPRRLLAVTGFVALMCGANATLSAAPWGIACGDGRVDTVLDDFDSPWEFCCTAAEPQIPKPTFASFPSPSVTP